MANVRSLRDEQELSFVAPEDDENERATARETELSDGRRLPVHTVPGVFGANASGKSNLIAALRNMRRCVLRSYADWTSYDGIPRDEFALDPKAADETSLYEADFVLADGVRWTYGFELGQRRVEAEWLYAYPKGAQLVFTAHDLSLLRTPGGGRLLHPGQIWLTEKDDRGATSLTSVADWDPTAEEDLMSSYLAGSFGAVPKVSEGQAGRRPLRTGPAR
ncbi:ATP/GTP-binding protein [Streptomyces sp. NPDC051740]|uniref:ATP/GTP-binding protein n=1 Tax=Streptomyces sp. NPDC051740 TaxID=3365673 RepID=UPI0037A83A93